MKDFKGIGCTESTKIMTDDVEEYAVKQILALADNDAFVGAKIRIMPDVHPGKVGPIGFTAVAPDTLDKKFFRIMPYVIGNDIGCGITIAKINKKKIDFNQLDKLIKENIPGGAKVRTKPHAYVVDKCMEIIDNLVCKNHVNMNKAILSLGTLGGGNHFIEIDKDDEGSLYIVVHSGSRSVGNVVTEHYMQLGHKELKAYDIPYELTYLRNELQNHYIWDALQLQDYAEINRNVIVREIVKGLKLDMEWAFSCSHNFIGLTPEGNMIIRKGAISANKNARVVIPINMRDGIILGTGLGNPDWNYSAPHGAGRLFSRRDVKSNFTVSQYKKEMEGIHCTCINKDTLDEAPFAYRKLDDIIDKISDTVKVDKIIKPIYNYKAGGRE